MTDKLYDRSTLQKIRDGAHRLANMASIPWNWKCAWERLAKAADGLDAMQAREDQRACQVLQKGGK